MTLQQYNRVRSIAAMVIALIVAQSIVARNFLIPVATVAVGALVLFAVRRNVKEVIADERDRNLAGVSALLAMQIFSWTGVVVMLALYAARDLNPSYEPMGMILAFAICFFMLLYSAIFAFKSRYTFSDKKILSLAAIGILFVFLAIAGMRAISGEDNWVCQNGAWVKHGNPDFPAPVAECT